MSQPTVLIIDDEKDILEEYGGLFREHPVEVITITDPKEAADILSSQPITVIVADQRMPEISGLELIQKAKDISPDTIRMILTAYAEQDLILDAINMGQVFRFLVKPCEPGEFVTAVLDAIDYFKERERVRKIIDARKNYLDAESDLEVLQTQLLEREAEVQMLEIESERLLSQQKEGFKAIFASLTTMMRTKNEALFINGKWVATFSMKVAKVLGLSENDQNVTYLSGYLKNIGLLLLPDKYMEKPIGMLTPDELSHYYRFPVLSEQILGGLPGFRAVAATVGDQLERCKGSGPRSKTAENTSVPAQIIGVADDIYRILFTRSQSSVREALYGKTYAMNHLRKNISKLYTMKVALAAIKVLEQEVRDAQSARLRKV